MFCDWYNVEYVCGSDVRMNEIIVISNGNIWFEEGLGLNTVISFGIYKGKKLYQLDLAYVNYLIKVGIKVKQEVFEYFAKADERACGKYEAK